MTRRSCKSSDSVASGTRPTRPKASRSSSVKAVDLLSDGSRRSSTPRLLAVAFVLVMLGLSDRFALRARGVEAIYYLSTHIRLPATCFCAVGVISTNTAFHEPPEDGCRRADLGLLVLSEK